MSGYIRITAYTPAETIAAAWIIALTGVGTFHCIGQPNMKRELRALAHRADEQKRFLIQRRHRQADDHRRLFGKILKEFLRCKECRGTTMCQHRAAEDVTRFFGGGHKVKISNAEQQRHVANAGRDKRFDRRAAWGDLLGDHRSCAHTKSRSTDANAQTHDLPTDEHE